MTRRYSDLEDLISDLDSDSLLDDPLLAAFDEDEIAMLGSGLPGTSKPRAETKPPAPKKRGRPKKKD